MSYNQTPWDFDEAIQIEGYKIKYENLREIGQGAPIIGNLLINGKQMPGYGFGGPLIYQNCNLYIPVYIKESSFGWGFKLAVIDLKNLSIRIFGERNHVLHLDKIENGRIYYFISWDKVTYNYYEGVVK
ncbi:hypothetical protein [Mucilaginibacter ginsenosidivorax]|uniref:Uncharacterized protein n=1 Tax=Mucilaginibacter ginsenosidivorax TaxID=862126 RepID=A0A5B8VW45_9SPHI|nr:hypothetical protein [Mucilaginibacter ginsenosidivorax]QEC75904.1 hypothetical protein FSB76_08070 [Mucilaginibacter ginsenosidivorax]